jgi:hypothetical protein
MTSSEPKLIPPGWRQAATLADLGDLTAQWLEGRRTDYPCYGGPVDPETVLLVESLAEINRLGLVTIFSQPGQPIDEIGFGQRAAVAGFATAKTAKRLARLGLHSDLLVMAFKPGERGGYPIPVSLADHRPTTFQGRSWGYNELDCFASACGSDAMAELEEAWKICLIDPHWGRNDYLWPRVIENLKGRPQDRPGD